MKRKCLKRIPLGKENVTKNALYFFSRPPIITVLLLICDSYMSCSLILTKSIGSLTLKCHIFFQN